MSEPPIHSVGAQRPNLPPLPTQGAGPHVELNADGVISRAPPGSLDREGNHIPRLRGLHPELRDLARDLAAALRSGNRPYAALEERVSSYLALIDQDLAGIDFARLYVAGLRLENAAHRARQNIAGGDLPPFDPATGEKLSSTLALHGVFMLATADGAALKLDEERYQRSPEEERQYRAAALAVTVELQNRPDILEPNVAKDISDAAAEMGTGGNPARSTIVGHATLRNVLVTLTAAAVASALLSSPATLLVAGGGMALWFGGLAVSDAVKKAQFFRKLTDQGAAAIDTTANTIGDYVSEAFRAGLDRHQRFAIKHEPMLRRLSRWLADMRFMDDMLNWIAADDAPSTTAEPASGDREALRVFGSRMVVELSLGMLDNHLRAMMEGRDGVTTSAAAADDQLQFPPGGTRALLMLGVPFDDFAVERADDKISIRRLPGGPTS